MKKLQFLCLVGALAMFLGAGISASAQSSPSSAPDTQAAPPAASDQSQPTSTPDTQTTPSSKAEQDQSTPGQTPDQANKPTPEAQAPATTSASPTDTQSFSGTIVKSGDKYMLQDEASGKSYDIDHQDEVQKFEGKRVKVKGTLDASGKMIHLQ